jgi:acyl-CoA reductase-like NAD-dependent aldehyde dehydrogenase
MLRITNPADNSLVAELPEDNSQSVAAKYARARAAQPQWAQTALAQRCAAIGRFRAMLVARKEALARLLTSEMGKPIRQARNEIQGTLARLDFFLDHTGPALADEVVLEQAGQKLIERISWEPLGVVASISAWNYPYFVGCNVFIPALLTGNAVLYKPSEFATLTGLEIGAMLHQCGVGADVFQVLAGAGQVGSALLEQPIDAVFFTGSYATGLRIAQAVSGRMIKLQLELGGKDPIYVCDDADVARAAESIADGAFYNSGQSCCSVERIYVHARIYQPFIEAFMGAVAAMKVGAPLDENTYIGPLTRSSQLGYLEQQVADAKARGARLLCGGARIAGPGNFFAPTVFAEADHTMALMREETFGPLVGIQRVSDDAQALELMNDTEYGLTAGVYSPDRARAERILAQVKSGSVYWNCCDRVSPRLPWSGVGHSGVGLTLSTHGIRAFTRPKAWHLRGNP